MSLVVVGNYELDEMEIMVFKYFEELEDKDVKLKDFSNDPNFDHS